jgi:hypothetical protein
VPECEDPCGYNDPDYADGNCVITQAPEDCGDKRAMEVAFQLLGATVPAPGGAFRSTDASLRKWVENRWQETADFTIPADVRTKLTKDGVKIWNYPDGNGWIRADFHAGILGLPAGQTPEALLRTMVDDVIGATGDDELAGWVGWPAVGAGQRKVGDRVDLDIWGPDNGAIGYFKIDPDRFCVITLENDSVGDHPVNGIRCWGFVPIQPNPNWLLSDKGRARWSCAGGTWMFYSIGIDSPSVAGGGGVGAGLQEGTWNALIRDLLRENDRNGGNSGHWYLQQTVAQPNALKPGGTTKVTGPETLKQYNISLPSDKFREATLPPVCEDPLLPAGDCAAGEFACADGQCIIAERRCDGVADCTDRDDEEACAEDPVDGCPANQFACDDGKCIPGEWHCDGQYPDCAGGEDEASCGDAPGGCTASEFTCGDGQCIPGWWECDVYPDCGDGSDEASCPDAGGGGGAPTAPTCNGFQCNDGPCIAAAWECDLIVDCAGGEDEADCAPEPPTDPTCDGFQCNDGLCIAADWECDLIVDCAGGEDESNC